MIGVSPSLEIKHLCRVVGEKALQARLSFDRNKYAGLDEIGRYEYYLTLLENGYRICTKFKEVPVDLLLQLHDDFRKGNYKNEWQFKKKKFTEHNIGVELRCLFRAIDFQLVIEIVDLKKGELLVKDVIMRTGPDEIFFQKEFKDIGLVGNSLVIYYFFDHPRIKIDIKSARKKILQYRVIGKDAERLSYYPSN